MNRRSDEPMKLLPPCFLGAETLGAEILDQKSLEEVFFSCLEEEGQAQHRHNRAEFR